MPTPHPSAVALSSRVQRLLEPLVRQWTTEHHVVSRARLI